MLYLYRYMYLSLLWVTLTLYRKRNILWYCDLQMTRLRRNSTYEYKCHFFLFRSENLTYFVTSEHLTYFLMGHCLMYIQRERAPSMGAMGGWPQRAETVGHIGAQWGTVHCKYTGHRQPVRQEHTGTLSFVHTDGTGKQLWRGNRGGWYRWDSQTWGTQGGTLGQSIEHTEYTDTPRL